MIQTAQTFCTGRHDLTCMALVKMWSGRMIIVYIFLQYMNYELIILSLTHWGRVTHLCVSKLTIIGSDNGLSPGRRQAIIWTNAGILLIRTLGTNFSEMLSEIRAFSFKKMHFKMSSAKWRPLCLGLNVLKELVFKDNVTHPMGKRQTDMLLALISLDIDIHPHSL